MEEGNQAKRVACSDDRLSNLSDELICHILSFMSTEEAYRTSVLSKRWAFISTMILDLHFNLPKLSYNSVLSKKTQSVYAALLRRNNNIRKLSLVGDLCCQPHDVHMWISKALDLNVQELYMDLILAKKTFLPLRLSTSKSLVVLKLCGKIQFKLNSSSNIYFPSLKILHLTLILFSSSLFADPEEFDLNFLSGCPRLEELYILDRFRHSINITLPLLKRLYLVLDIPNSLYFMPEVGTIKLNLLSPLDMLQIADTSARKYEFVNLPNVDQVSLFIRRHPDSHNNLYTLLKGLCNVKSLTLSSDTVEYLIHSMEDNLHNLRLLTFHNLTSLFLSVNMSENYRWNMLINFLQSAPNLKYLAIKKILKSEDENSSLLKCKDRNSGWEEPSLTPTCLSSSLITFEFKGIQNIAEFNFMRYIIERSSKLENVKISTKEKVFLLDTNLLKRLKKKSHLRIGSDEIDKARMKVIEVTLGLSAVED